MAGALLSSAILALSCSEDIPSYSELTVDKNEVFIEADGNNPIAEVSIIQGNGNYKLTVDNEDIATATLEGDKIAINGLKNGQTFVTIMDCTNHSAVITVKVKEYFDLTLSETELIMIKGEEPVEISILYGNGGYQVASGNEAIVTAELNESGKILFTAIETGVTDVTVTDADGKTETVKVTVTENLLKLEDITGRFWKVDETLDIAILSGNGEYTVTSNNESVATAVIDGDKIKVTGHQKGDAKLTITDKMGLTQTINIPVKSDMKIDKETIELLVIGNNKTESKVTILEGSGDYTLTFGPSVTVTLCQDKKELTIKGVDEKPALNQKVIIEDKVLGNTAIITIKEVNYPFDEYGKGRYFIEGNIGVPAASKFETKDGRERLRMGSSGTTTKNGYIVSFEGGRAKGVKTAPQLYQLDNSGAEVNPITISDLEIVKTEAIDAKGDGKYWIKFREAGKNEDSYIVTWT